MGIQIALEALLNKLDKISTKHSEIHDTAVREELYLTIRDYFVAEVKDLPQDETYAYYAMFSDEGNNEIHQALTEFLAHPDVKAVGLTLTSPTERLAAFQDDMVKSSIGTYYAEFFGWSDEF